LQSYPAVRWFGSKGTNRAHCVSLNQKLWAIIRGLYPWLRHIFADGGYAGDKLRGTLASMGRWTVQIIKAAARCLSCRCGLRQMSSGI